MKNDKIESSKEGWKETKKRVSRELNGGTEWRLEREVKVRKR